MKQPHRHQHNLLFLPFMQIASGHHEVADTLMYECDHHKSRLKCNKVDILSYSYGWVEKLVSSVYLSWISNFPSSYHLLYDITSYRNRSERKRNFFYAKLFIPCFKKLIHEMNPNLIICTHALPSSIASQLKQKNRLNQIIINVYTDFFINRVWGLEGIDYHFAPTIHVKEYLLEEGISESRIFVTGIPVHPIFRIDNGGRHAHKQSVLITGGNLGLGGIEKILSNTDGDIHFYILCGKNERLYQRLNHYEHSHITPLPYIKSKGKMNELYNKVDAVLTKPGGVTISECLMKKKTIFVYNPLPGQEKFNVKQLLKLGVIMPI